MKRALLSWSSGKDSAWALHLMRSSAVGTGVEIAGLLTTFNQAADRVAMHAVRRTLVEAQAAAAGLPLRAVELPWPCSNEEYESRMAEACRSAVADGFEAIAFGDLFLRDIREYRERKLAGSGLEPLFPLWELPTRELALEMIRAGLRARITCVDKKQLDASFAGREFDLAMLADLPPQADPCGENGEFHTFAYDGPMFQHPIPVEAGELRDADGFVFADLKSIGEPAKGAAARRPAIVSMISSATEIVHALGALPWLVGRSHECDYPAEVRALPACTAPRFAVDGDSREIDSLVRQSMAESLSVYQVFDDVLERLQPTHILTQIHCEVCAVSLRDVERSVAARLASRPVVVSLQPFSLAEVWEDIRRVARSLEIEARGEQVVAQFQERMRSIADITHGTRAVAPRPRLACIEWIEPLMPTANWMPELIEMAGAENVQWRTWEDLAAADPDIILAMPCGFDLERAVSEMYWLTARDGWDRLRAVRNGRVYVADGNQYFNRPGPRLVESLEILAGIVHPEVFTPRHTRSAATAFPLPASAI